MNNHKYYLMRHRAERRAEPERTMYNASNDRPPVAGRSVSCQYGRFHVVVLAQSELIALASLSSEVFEIELANY